MRFTSLATAVLVIAIATMANAQFSVLYNFGSTPPDPWGSSHPGIVVQGRDGNMYSTGPGGSSFNGVVYKITPAGVLTVLSQFDKLDGSITLPGLNPSGGLTLGTDGNFYGTTLQGGAIGHGVVFKVTPRGNLTVLHNFSGVAGDGTDPSAAPIQGSDGNFYGTTISGGRNAICFGGCGTVYKITPSGKFTSIYQFDNMHGANPLAPLLQGTDGNFYGTTSGGGSGNCGVVFKVTGAGKLTVLYSFDSTHGCNPLAGLIQAGDGNFYGTTYLGGSAFVGVVFKMTPSGKLEVLHNFLGGATDGAEPFAAVLEATDGNFYGATQAGGNTNACPYGCGLLFRITRQGTFTALYAFEHVTGADPQAAIMQNTNGILYGDTPTGGGVHSYCPDGCGVFYSLDQGLRPFISLVSTAGYVGQTIQLLGRGLTGTTQVFFNRTRAETFTVASDTFLTVRVPSGATNGFVTVTMPNGTLTSNKAFRVLPRLPALVPAVEQ